MRINKFVAQCTALSRRAADSVIMEGLVSVNGVPAQTGQETKMIDEVRLDGQILKLPDVITVMLNKPVGYVCSRDGQGSRTIYDLLPAELHSLKPVGRLDKDSSGLLLLTNDGGLSQKLTHPSFQKEKVYEVVLDKPLAETDKQQIEKGIELEDGLSRLQVKADSKQQSRTVNRQLSAVSYIVRMHEGKNRQIRRTFSRIGYDVIKLHRTQFGDYKVTIKSGDWQKI